ncbi:MAG: lysophospholipase, partial [Gemmatimonadota bacterium]|nr:lysophospholipase [Gemmatimonadota bacterium]
SGQAFTVRDEVIDDVVEAIALARKHPRIDRDRVFVLGHSLGGLIALDLAVQRTPRAEGIIAAAPPLGAVGVPPVLMALGRMMARVWPRFSLNVGMDLTGLSRDPAVVETITSDPLFHRRGTARLSVEVPRAIARVHEHARRIAVPLLLLHGTSDRMVPPDGTRSFFARFMNDGADPLGPAAPGEYVAPERDVTLRLYADAYHALFFDVGRDEVRSDVVRWMRARSARPA